ncbi:metal/formaldehyde-sensitive transcriptional repressor [Sphingobium algorifonticola]|uniref:Metal/formaldehyde-sensitive transcriptional repressor n=1 Tax=Sphingobium algorifonticola TaxID=2008318 RepID=A0A437JCN8_9SPHN|nr:metal/formaldehyde-sensitive transcriptional repressor [Sphingobium algorifonticola]RVT43510.1 metal/formaldehyde-sensitive transcriptional repressor [Sphingobium algorifonticola]
MGHHVADRDKLLARVRRIAGQVAAIERQLHEEADCATTLQLVASVRGAIGGLMEELIESHVREHMARPGLTDAARAAAAEELLAIIRRYGK